MLRTNEVLSFFSLAMIASSKRSSAVSSKADELSDSSFSAALLLLCSDFNLADLVDFVDFDRCEFRLKLSLLKRISERRVDNGVAPGADGEYFKRFEAGGAGMQSASASAFTVLM